MASNFLTPSTGLVKGWATWNQWTFAERGLNSCSMEERNVRDMSQTTSMENSAKAGLWFLPHARFATSRHPVQASGLFTWLNDLRILYFFNSQL
jgi:hypothetical protein